MLWERNSTLLSTRQPSQISRWLRVEAPGFTIVGRHLVLGVLLGIVLGSVGFTSPSAIESMLRFKSLHLWGAFGVGVFFAGIGLRLARCTPPTRTFHPGLIPGALLFGIGWSLSGFCPGAALAALGKGEQHGAVACMGVVLGTALYSIVHRSFFRWDRGSCAD
ncbi:MAG: YeeE/YedE thiosulfate transporter family protein [Sandaracinaceae bacterium]|nr:YeeE/YedE thiosulfate transporter family protein [Sandaracinaceae bacterium]